MNGVFYWKWNEILKDLSNENLIGRNYRRYMNELVICDLEKRMENVDELDQILFLESILKLLDNERIYTDKEKIKETKLLLQKLKKKYKNKIKIGQKKFIDDLIY